jgi:very-short-patch-repair endonuclease
MIFVKSFTTTELIAANSDSTRKSVEKVVSTTTEEMQCWVEKEEEFAETHFKDGYVKVISTSTQLVVNEYIVSYVITAIIELDGQEQ